MNTQRPDDNITSEEPDTEGHFSLKGVSEEPDTEGHRSLHVTEGDDDDTEGHFALH